MYIMFVDFIYRLIFFSTFGCLLDCLMELMNIIGFTLTLAQRSNVFHCLFGLLSLLFSGLFSLDIFFGITQGLFVFFILNGVNLFLELVCFLLSLLLSLLLPGLELFNLLFAFCKLFLVFGLLNGESLFLSLNRLLVLDFHGEFLLLNELILDLFHLIFNKFLRSRLSFLELIKLGLQPIVDDFLPFLQDLLFIKLLLELQFSLVHLLFKGIGELF